MKSFVLIIALFSSGFSICQGTRGEIPNVYNNEKEVVGKYHAIIISETDYQDESISDLAETKDDADKLYTILVDKYNFNSSDIIRLVDPTRNEVIDALDKKSIQLSEDDNLLIFYAGHGYWDEDLKMGYWFPSDARKDHKGNWLENTTLTTYIKAFRAKHVLLISDACFSGSIFKMRSVGPMDSGMKRLNNLKSRKAISSGNMKEVPQQSVFIRFLLKELNNNADEFLSTDQLFAKIRPNIQNNSQTDPLYGVIQMSGDEGGEFVFYNSQSENVIYYNSRSKNAGSMKLVKIKTSGGGLKHKDIYKFNGTEYELINGEVKGNYIIEFPDGTVIEGEDEVWEKPDENKAEFTKWVVEKIDKNSVLAKFNSNSHKLNQTWRFNYNYKSGTYEDFLVGKSIQLVPFPNELVKYDVALGKSFKSYITDLMDNSAIDQENSTASTSTKSYVVKLNKKELITTYEVHTNFELYVSSELHDVMLKRYKENLGN